MRIVSWNVNGLYTTLKDAALRYSSVSHFFSEILKADIACFQEAKIQEEKLEKWLCCVPGYESFWAFSVEKKGYSGVVTYVKEELSPLDARADYLDDFDYSCTEELCREGRLMETDHGNFILINVYVPNAGERDAGQARLGYKLKFLEALKLRCDELSYSGKPVIIVGDFNIAHRDIDIYKTWNIRDLYSSEELAWIDSFLLQYVDLFRHFHPDATDIFSVWNQKTQARIRNEGLRIDYAVCDRAFLSQVLDTEIVKMVPKEWSDHAAVVLTVKDQPVLPFHPIPLLSSRNMKRFQDDHSQKKISDMFTFIRARAVQNADVHMNVGSQGTSSVISNTCKGVTSNLTNFEKYFTKADLQLIDSNRITQANSRFPERNDSVPSGPLNSNCGNQEDHCTTCFIKCAGDYDSFVNKPPEIGQAMRAHSIESRISTNNETEMLEDEVDRSFEERSSCLVDCTGVLGQLERHETYGCSDNSANNAQTSVSENRCINRVPGMRHNPGTNTNFLAGKGNNKNLQVHSSRSKRQKKHKTDEEVSGLQNRQKTLPSYFVKDEVGRGM